MQPVEEMIGEVDDVGGGSASWSREDPMTQSDKLHDEQSGLTKKASDSDDETDINYQSFTCVEISLPSEVKA